jgi:PRTRC genetic system protein A
MKKIKSFFWKLSEYLNSSERVPINIIAGRDGKLYEIRESVHLRVVQPNPHVRELDEVKEGISFKLPKVPRMFLESSLNFFRYFAEKELEALVYITWNNKERRYAIHCPNQVVKKEEVKFELPGYDPDSDVVIIMHSHHNMPASFSPTDDINDQALAVYGVFGQFNQKELKYKFRAGYNGKHFPVSIVDLFDFTEKSLNVNSNFPQEWLERVLSMQSS